MVTSATCVPSTLLTKCTRTRCDASAHTHTRFATAVSYVVRVRGKREADHLGSEVGATDANVHHVGDLLASVSTPLARADLFHENDELIMMAHGRWRTWFEKVFM